MVYVIFPTFTNKKLRYHRGTARRAMSVEILSNAAQLYETSHLKSSVEWPWRWLKVIEITSIQ